MYDEVEVEDMEFDVEDMIFYYPCPCGDLFSIELEELLAGEDIAMCPSCSLTIRVIYETRKLRSFNKNVSGEKVKDVVR